MALTNQIHYEAIRTIDSSTFTGSYQTLGTALVNPACIIKILNMSSVNVTVSTDGVNDMDFVPANSVTLYDYTSNTPPGSISGDFVAEKTQYLVKGSAGIGSVYLVVQYIKAG